MLGVTKEMFSTSIGYFSILRLVAIYKKVAIGKKIAP